MELHQLRNQIDELDRELVACFVKRMRLSAEVAAYKREHGLPVLDRAREAALLDQIAEQAGSDFAPDSRALYEKILSLSRAYQERLLDSSEEETP